MKIEVEVKQRYGKPRFYPLSPDAKLLTDLIGKPTLTKDHLTKCKAAGWEITIIAPTYKIEDFI